MYAGFHAMMHYPCTCIDASGNVYCAVGSFLGLAACMLLLDIYCDMLQLGLLRFGRAFVTFVAALSKQPGVYWYRLLAACVVLASVSCEFKNLGRFLYCGGSLSLYQKQSSTA